MRNFLMLLAAVLGTSVMVHAFPPASVKVGPAKEIKATQPKAKSEKKTDKKAKTEKKETSKTETAKMKK